MTDPLLIIAIAGISAAPVIAWIWAWRELTKRQDQDE